MDASPQLSDLWITSLLFDLNYKFINRSYALSLYIIPFSKQNQTKTEPEVQKVSNLTDIAR